MRLSLSVLAGCALVGAAVLSPQVQSGLMSGEVLAQQENVPAPNPNCSPYGNAVPAGVELPPPSDEPNRPIWCYSNVAQGVPTFVQGTNDWVDTYDNNGPALQTIASNYHVYSSTAGGGIVTGAFVNDDHWQFDIADASQYRLSGGMQLSPSRSFRFENGMLVVEGDMAAGSFALGGADAFSEIDISAASAPTGITVDPLYGYGTFGGVGALGCRFERQSDGPHIVCAQYDNSHRDAGGTDVTGGPSGRPGRLWETQGAGTANTASSVQGGYPDWPIPGTNLHVRDVWRICPDASAYEECLDRFRMEITKTSVHILVNGYTVMLIDGLYASNPATGADNRVPDSWISNGVYPYYTSWINDGMHHTTRFYWDRIAVNPHAGSGFAAPSASPTFCLGQPNNTCPEDGGSTPPPPTNTPTPVRTATPLPTNTPPPGATATPTPNAGTASAVSINFDNMTNPNRAFSGQYPNGVADWGTNAWYLSGPWAGFRTNSVSFNGSGPTSASFTFTTARKLLQVDVNNGGTTTTTVSLACAGQPTVQQQIAAGQVVTMRTGWGGTCTRVSISSTNGWFTNFDNFLIQ